MKGILPISINTIFWSFVGALRYLTASLANQRRKPINLSDQQLAAAIKETAICLPAHNEELVIKDTIASLQKLVPVRQIYVISDGSSDQTANIARALGCIVLEQTPGLGKAKAIEKAIEYFRLLNRYRFLLVADADTVFDQNFLHNALPLFDKEKSVAVIAAYTKTKWHKHKGYKKKMLFVAYRMRLYEFIQPFIMYGQTWHRTNVNPVIPGFACLYRTDILRHLSFAVPGIIIEDFSMAFQLHKKKLGTIAHHSSVIATTQDPNNMSDYRRQLLRWNLGFFQTVRHWGVWPSVFWLSLGVSITEMLIFSALLFLLPALLVLIAIYRYTQPLHSFNYNTITWLSDHWKYLLAVYLALFLADYFITLYVAIKEREDKLAVYGLAFFFLRYVDAAIFFCALAKATTTVSSGIWKPPLRRAQ